MPTGVDHIPLDLSGFERLYRATTARVYTLARRLVGSGGAEEATQEVYLRAWCRRDSYRGEAAASTWLHRLAVNELINQARGVRRRPEAVELERDPTRSDSDDLRLDLERALERLPDGSRHVFVLHDVEGLRHDEIADRLGVSVGTSKSQLHRARVLLRRALRSWSEASDA